MIRYSTPKIIISTDLDLSVFAEIWVTFKQDEIIIKKTKTDILIKNNNEVEIQLSQEETSQFKAYKPVFVQIRYITPDDLAGGSEIKSILFDESLQDEIISYENTN